MIPAFRARIAGSLLAACCVFTGCSNDDPKQGANGDDSATVDGGSGDDGEKAPDARAPMRDASVGVSNPGSGASRDGGRAADAGADTPDPGSMDGGGGSNGPASGGSVFPAVSDPSADGPYKTKTVTGAGPGSNYTVFQPDPLGADGVKHPVLTWGNGGSTTPDWYSMLPHLASHGFVVVAANTVPQIDMEVPLSDDMLKGMDWILEQNSSDGSEYYGKLDSARVAPFGYSMGGLATFVLVGDPRWVTSVHLSGGNMGKGPERIAKAHAPMFWECGTTDIAGANCDDDFKALTNQSVFYGTLNDVDHLGILEPDAGKVISGAVTAWFRYYLMNDQSYKPYFAGADCTLCKDTKTWKVQKKNYD